MPVGFLFPCWSLTPLLTVVRHDLGWKRRLFSCGNRSWDGPHGDIGGFVLGEAVTASPCPAVAAFCSVNGTQDRDSTNSPFLIKLRATGAGHFISEKFLPGRAADIVGGPFHLGLGHSGIWLFVPPQLPLPQCVSLRSGLNSSLPHHHRGLVIVRLLHHSEDRHNAAPFVPRGQVQGRGASARAAAAPDGNCGSACGSDGSCG
jgi:hypothetical protein